MHFKGKDLFFKNMIMRLDVKKEACMVYLLRKYLMLFWAFVKLTL